MAATKREWYIVDDSSWTNIRGLNRHGEGFTVGTVGVDEDFNVTSLKFLGYIVGTPPTLYAAIKAIDGEGKPTGPDLSTGSVDPGGWSGDPEWHEISLSAYTLLASTQYALILYCPDGTAGDEVLWRFDHAGAAYVGGMRVRSYDGGESWSVYTDADMMFEIWGEPAVSYIELDGVVDIECTTAGELSKGAIEELTGTIDIECTTSGILSKGAVEELTGSIIIECTTAGDMKLLMELTGAIDIEWTTSGSLGAEFGLSNYAENKLLELLIGKTVFAVQTTYIGLCNANPGEEATGADCHEVPNTAGYARVETGDIDWNDASGGVITNATEIAFTYSPGGSWGVITHYVILDSGEYGQGNVLVYGTLKTPKGIVTGANVKFAAGELCLELD